MRTQNGTGNATEAATVPEDVGMVLEVDDSRPHHHRLNPKTTVGLVKGSKIFPLDLAQNVVKGLPTKMSLCLPHQCLHPLSQSQSLFPPTSHQ